MRHISFFIGKDLHVYHCHISPGHFFIKYRCTAAKAGQRYCVALYSDSHQRREERGNQWRHGQVMWLVIAVIMRCFFRWAQRAVTQGEGREGNWQWGMGKRQAYSEYYLSTQSIFSHWPSMNVTSLFPCLDILPLMYPRTQWHSEGLPSCG